jgi:hypothetical protein
MFEQTEFPGKRRLVEECEAVSVFTVRRLFGKAALLRAIREARPLLLPVSGGQFEVCITFESHRLPGNQDTYACLERGTVRLWLSCPACRRSAAKLFFYRIKPGPSTFSRLLCRHCHSLTYQSSNCGKNRWYQQFARPLKKLMRRRERVDRWSETARKRRFLAIIDRKLADLRSSAFRHTRCSPGGPASRTAGNRRRYKNLSLVL